MVRRKDPFWEHVEQFEDRFKCNYCHGEYHGGISRVKSHLSGIKGRDIEICQEVPEEVQAAAFLAIGASNKKAKTTGSSSNFGGGELSTQFSHSLSNDVYQSTRLESCKKMDKSLVDKLLAKTIILNNIAFNVVQTPSFITFIKSVAEFGPTYKLPSYSTLRAKLIPDCGMEVEIYIANVKKSWTKTGCTLMYDIWSDLKKHAFINIVAYSPGGGVFMNSFEISKGKKTGLYLRDIMASVIDDIGPENVVQLITDNTTNFESVGEMLIGKYSRMYKTKCAAGGMQLLLKEIYSKIQWVQNIIDDANLIVTYMYKHTIILSMMREYTNNRELKHPCATRFSSNFLMLQSVLEVEDGLRLLVASPEWKKLGYSREEMAKNVTNIIQASELWNQGKEVLEVLEPLFRVLRLVDGDGSTSGYLYEAMERAKEAIKQRCGNNQAKYIQIWKLFEERSENIIHPIHAAAAFLNPAYMCSDNFREVREMKEGINFMLSNLVLVEEKEDFVRQVQLYRMKMSNLFTDIAMTMMKTSHPRVWWDYCGDCLPVLQKYAIRILSQPCSSSSCERNWSACEAAQTKKRMKLAPKMLDNLVYIRMNTMMMEKFNTLEERDLELIDLEKLSQPPKNVDHERDEDDFSSDLINEISDDDLIVCKKHYPPTLHDEVWRLDKIVNEETLHEKLIKADIVTVEDFVRVLIRDPQRLRNILGTGMSSRMWENTVEHAKTCVLDRKLYVYYKDGTNSVGAVFNDIYELRGIVADGQFLPLESLTNNQKISADSLVKRAYENWNQVVEYDGKVVNSLLNENIGTRASAAAIPDHSHVTTAQSKQLRITSEPSPQSHTKNHNTSNSQLIEFPSRRSDTMGGMVLNTPQAALAGTVDYGSIGMPAFGSSYLLGEWSRPRDGQGYEDFFPEEIRLRSSEMLSDDMQRLFKTCNTGVGVGMGYAFGHSDGACSSRSFPHEHQLDRTYGQVRGRSSGRAVVQWLKLKAAMRWGIFVRKKAAERRAQLLELDDD